MLEGELFELKWREIKHGFRHLWGRISEEELEQYKYQLTDLLPIVKERYSETDEEIHHKFQRLVDSFENDTDRNISPDVTSYQRRPPGAEDYQREFDLDRNARH